MRALHISVLNGARHHKIFSLVFRRMSFLDLLRLLKSKLFGSFKCVNGKFVTVFCTFCRRIMEITSLNYDSNIVQTINLLKKRLK